MSPGVPAGRQRASRGWRPLAGVSDGGYGLPRGQLAGVVQLHGLLCGRLVVTDTAHTRRVEGYLQGERRETVSTYNTIQ